MAGDHGTFVFYHYYPTMAGAVMFIILFLITTIFHCYQLARTKTWYFIPFVIGGFFEVIGYVGRAMSSHQSPDWTLGPYIMQSVLLLVAPALFAASLYMILGRIVMVTEGDAHSIIRPRLLTKLFVSCDILSFLMQSSGGGLMASAGSQKMGQNIILAGLFVQLIGFGLFICVAILFHVRITKVPTSRILNSRIPWQKHIYVLYLTSILIFVRSIVRVIEYLQGWDGYILSHEWYLYVFDATLMLLVMVALNVVHPSEITAYLKGGPYVRSVVIVEDVKSPVVEEHYLRTTSNEGHSHV